MKFDAIAQDIQLSILSRRFRSLLFICFFPLASCVSSTYVNEPIFQTTIDSPDTVEDNESYKPYIFMTQYFADVDNRLSINIKAADSNGPVQVTISPVATPKSRYYLYVLKNAFFQDNIDVKTNSSGLLTNATIESQQQITAIVTSIGKAVGGIIPASMEREPEDKCKQAIDGLPKNTFLTTDVINYQKKGINVHVPGTNLLRLKIEFPQFQPQDVDTHKSIRGIIVFFPYPVEVSLYCNTTQLTSPQKINLYMDRHVITPKRDFLTNENHNTLISEGFYLGQTLKTDSAAKTIVDTALAPVQSIVPTVNITNTVTSVPGKADDIKTVTTTTTPKQ